MPKRNSIVCVAIQVNLSPVDATWLACALDTEGWVCFHRQYRRGDEQYFSPFIGVGNTDTRFIDKVRSLTPGIAWNTIVRLPVGIHRKTMYQLRTDRTGAIRGVLEAVLPYLIIKREKAEAMLKWITIRSQSNSLRRPHSVEEMNFINLVRDLNFPHKQKSTGDEVTG